MGWLRDPYIACNLQPQQIPGPRHQINCKIATTQDIYPLSQPLSSRNRQQWVVSTWRFSRYDSGYAIRRQRVPLVPFFPSDPKIGTTVWHVCHVSHRDHVLLRHKSRQPILSAGVLAQARRMQQVASRQGGGQGRVRADCGATEVSSIVAASGALAR